MAAFSSTALFHLLSFKMRLERRASLDSSRHSCSVLMGRQRKLSRKEKTNVSSKERREDVRGEGRNGGVTEQVFFCSLHVLQYLYHISNKLH